MDSSKSYLDLFWFDTKRQFIIDCLFYFSVDEKNVFARKVIAKKSKIKFEKLDLIGMSFVKSMITLNSQIWDKNWIRPKDSIRFLVWKWISFAVFWSAIQ